MDTNDKKEEALEHLRNHPMDYNGAARIMEMEMDEFLVFRGLYLKEFHNAEDGPFNWMEHLCMLKALGQPMPEGYEDFDFNKAMKILQCKRGWSATTKVERVPVKQPESTGEGKRLIEEYFSKQENEDGDGEVTILSETERRNLQ